jgi:hypothetical protein
MNIYMMSHYIYNTTQTNITCNLEFDEYLIMKIWK